MPKIKSNRGASKRFRLTANGKLKRGSANKSHILTKKTTKRKRALRSSSYVSESDAPKIKRIIPYK